MSAPELVFLQSSDNATFEVDETVARKSETIKHMIDDGYTNTTIPLPNVTGPILANVIEYCRRHAEANDEDDEDVKNFDADFVRRVDRGTLFEIILAANYLDIKGLMDLTCQTVADMIKDMRVEEVRNIFNIENDFTPQEEEELRRENAWAFE